MIIPYVVKEMRKFVVWMIVVRKGLAVVVEFGKICLQGKGAMNIARGRTF